MKQNKKLSLGIIGCGKVAVASHLPALKNLNNVTVTALSDTDETKMAELAGALPVKHCYPDYRDLINDPAVEAVGILTPPDSHADIGCAALDAGKHILVEKPLALTLEECDRLIAKETETGLIAGVCFNQRRHRLVRQAKRILDDGLLGPVRYIRSVYTHPGAGATTPAWHRFARLGGGATMNEGVHHFDLWYHLTGKSITHVSAFHEKSDDYDDSACTVNAALSGGGLATFYAAFGTAPNSELEIYGEKGRLCLNLYRFDGIGFYPESIYPGNIRDRVIKAAGSIRQLCQTLPRMIQSRGRDMTFTAAWEDFIGSVLENRKPFATLEDGRRAAACALAAEESYRKGTAISLTGPSRPQPEHQEHSQSEPLP